MRVAASAHRLSWRPARQAPHLNHLAQVANDTRPAGPRLEECNPQDGASLLLRLLFMQLEGIWPGFSVELDSLGGRQDAGIPGQC